MCSVCCLTGDSLIAIVIIAIIVVDNVIVIIAINVTAIVVIIATVIVIVIVIVTAILKNKDQRDVCLFGVYVCLFRTPVMNVRLSNAQWPSLDHQIM